MRPLISYYGGKQKLAKRIVSFIESIPHTVYAEPFAGGLSVFYSRDVNKFPKKYYREYINDNSELLINLYRVGREQPEEFERLIQFTPYSQADHARAIQWCRNPVGRTNIELAWAYYVNINQSFSKMLNAGWSTSIFSTNPPDVWLNRKNRLPESLKRLEKAYISCEDAIQFLDRVDSPQTLAYIDPPYPGAVQGHYGGYTLEDWKNLCSWLDQAQCSYVLSGYPQSIEPKSSQKRVEFKKTMCARGLGKTGKNRDKTRAATPSELGDRSRTEVLWVCDRSSSMRQELKELFNIES